MNVSHSHPLPRAVLFDHDGTLVDTEPIWAEGKTRLAAQYGATWTEQDTLDCLGQPMAMTTRRLQELGVDLPETELHAALGTIIRELVTDEPVTFLPGIAALLEELDQAGVPAAIVTNATVEIASRTAQQGPKGLFRALIGNESVTSPKPDPQPYLLAAEQLGVDPTECVALEDSPSGVTSATRAGAKVVVVPGMRPVEAELGVAHIPHDQLSLARLQELFTEDSELVTAASRTDS